MIELHKGDCLDIMKMMLYESIDLTVTSPPYDNLREYNGNISQWNEHKWKGILSELFRITKIGGVVVWVVGDATIKGSETGTSFKQALYAKEIGFNLYDTMIWDKQNCSSVGSLKRYENVFEYMFIFSKERIKAANIIKDKPNKRHGETQHGSIRQKDGSVRKTSNYGKKAISEFGRRHNVWHISPCKSTKERLHPAPFPEQLAQDHILSWSNENDTVFDPMMGSGTTGKMAVLNNRNFIGIEIDDNYFNLAQERINQAKNNQQLEMKGV